MPLEKSEDRADLHTALEERNRNLSASTEEEQNTVKSKFVKTIKRKLVSFNQNKIKIKENS